MLKLAALVGPTAVGKTEISLGLAQVLDGEIISCDSMQIYKGMDIGTAKANKAQRSQVAHHVIDMVDPQVNFTVADYQKLAQQAIKDINERGKIPIMVGGTGLYYQSVVDNYDFYPMESKQAVRDKWEQIHNEQGLDYLYNKLLVIDKPYALKVGSQDKKRIVRALEVFDLTGQPFSAIQSKRRNHYRLSVVGLYMERRRLYERIEQRVDQMIADGLLDEVIHMRKNGCDLSNNSMQALGYKQVFYYLQGMLTWQDMIAQIKKETRNLAKRQYTWFNKDKRIHWINVDDYDNQAALLGKISEHMEGLS